MWYIQYWQHWPLITLAILSQALDSAEPDPLTRGLIRGVRDLFLG